MPIEEEEIIGSHTEDSEVVGTSDDNTDDVMSMFDIKEDEEEKSFNDKPPAIEEVKTAEPKIEKVKHNKEEVDVDISTTEKLHDHLQRSLALDKERERKTELERNLDRAAKLAGFKDHTEYAANLDRIEKEHQQQVQDQFEQAKQKIIDDLVYNGVDEQTAREYADNNPLIQQAKAAIEKEQLQEQERLVQLSEQQKLSSWDELYKAFPDIVEDSKKFSEGGRADFYTPEMERMYMAGYKPLDAYKLAHMDKIQTKTARDSQQRLIKEQRLGLRSQVETNAAPDNETAVPANLANAFEAFGMTATEAKKYMKK